MDDALLRFRDDEPHDEPAVTLDAFLGQSNATAVQIGPATSGTTRTVSAEGAEQFAAGDVTRYSRQVIGRSR